jgi:hypoxia up-regulated 1
VIHTEPIMLSCRLQRPLLFFWLILILFSFINVTQEIVMGIDFGSQYFKIAVVRPGGIDIVLNEQSARKTQSLIAFRLDTIERLFGDAAAQQMTRTPETAYPYLSNLLQPRNLSAVQSLYGEHLPFLSRVWVRPDDNLLAVNLTSTPEEWSQLVRKYNSSAVSSLSANYTVVDLLAMLLQRAKWMAARSVSGAPIQDVVLTVPVWSTQAERHLLIQAAQIAGLNVLELIHAPTAAALKYGIERDFLQPQHVVFIDLGESGLQVELIAFSQHNRSEQSRKKNTTVSQLTVLASAWSTAISGREFDACLVRAVLRRLRQERGTDPFANTPPDKYARAVTKLRRHLKKVKENLSANKEVHFSIENLLGDERDYSGFVTRDELERECASLFEHLLPPLNYVLTAGNLTVRDVAAVELIGGSSRVPKVQEMLRTFFQRDSLDHHLNADEAAAFGAAYYAASLSSAHHVAKGMKVKDIASWPVRLQLTSADTKVTTSLSLFTRASRLGSKKTLTFTTTQPFNITLSYEQQLPPLSSPPPLLPTPLLSHYIFTNIPRAPADSSSATVSTPPKIHIAFRLTSSGLVTLESAYADYTTTSLSVSNSSSPSAATETATIRAEKTSTRPQQEGSSNSNNTPHDAHTSKETNEKRDKTPSASPQETVDEDNKEASSSTKASTSDQTTTTPENTAANTTTAASTSPPPKPIRRVHRVQLHVEHISPVFSLYNTTQMRAEAKKRLEVWNTLEREREEIVKLRNQLETRLYELRDMLSEPEREWFRYSYPSERRRTTEVLNRVQEWLEESGSSATLDALQQQLQAIHNATHTVDDRITATARRFKAWQMCRKLSNTTHFLLSNLTLSHNVTEEEVADAKSKLSELERWLNSTEAEQRARDVHIDTLWTRQKEGHDITSEPETYLEPVVTADEIDKRCLDVHQAIRPLLVRPRRLQNMTSSEMSSNTSRSNSSSNSSNTSDETSRKVSTPQTEEKLTSRPSESPPTPINEQQEEGEQQQQQQQPQPQRQQQQRNEQNKSPDESFVANNEPPPPLKDEL